MSGERTETATGIGTQMRIDNGELVEVIAEERWFVVKVIGGTGPPGGLRRVCDGTTACGSAVEYMPRERVRPTAKDPRFIDIVHSVPPGPDSTLVEVEDEDGRGMRLGEWVERQDGTWALRIHAGDIEATMLPRRERATTDGPRNYVHKDFHAAVVEKTRVETIEACAKVCDDHAHREGMRDPVFYSAEVGAVKRASAAIRGLASLSSGQGSE